MWTSGETLCLSRNSTECLQGPGFRLLFPCLPIPFPVPAECLVSAGILVESRPRDHSSTYLVLLLHKAQLQSRFSPAWHCHVWWTWHLPCPAAWHCHMWWTWHLPCPTPGRYPHLDLKGQPPTAVRGSPLPLSALGSHIKSLLSRAQVTNTELMTAPCL